MKKKIMMIFIINSIFSFHLDLSHVGDFIKSKFNEVKNPIENFFKKKIPETGREISDHFETFFKELQKLGPKFEELKLKLKDIFKFFMNPKNYLEVYKKTFEKMNSDLEDINKKIGEVKNFPEKIKNLRSKNEKLKTMLENLQKQVDSQNEKINTNMKKYFDEIKEIQERETISENLEKEIELNLKEIYEKQNQMKMIKDNTEEDFFELKRQIENSKLIIEDLKKKISNLQKEKNDLLKKQQEEEIKQKMEDLEKIKKDISEEKSKKIEENKQNIIQLQKTQLDHFENIKIMENGIDQVESKKNEDMLNFLNKINQDDNLNNESKNYLNAFKDIANSYLSQEE